MSSTVRNVLIGALGVVVLLLMLATNRYIHWKTESELKDQTIKEYKETSEKKGESEKVDDKTATNINKIEKDAKITEDKIREEVNDRVTEIQKDFQKQLDAVEPVTVQKEAVIASRDRAVSEVRMQGLWKSFCSGTKDPDACLKANIGEVTK